MIQSQRRSGFEAPADARSMSQEGSYAPALYGRPAAEGRVFVSSHIGRRHILRKEREAARKAIEGFSFLRAWMWERDAHAGPYSSESVCLGTATQSDALVLLVGRRLTSITRKEYEAARRAGVPCFVFVKEGLRRERAASEFVREVQLLAITKPFRSPNDLRSAIALALGSYFLSVARKRTLNGCLTYAQTDERSTNEASSYGTLELPPPAVPSKLAAPAHADNRVAQARESAAQGRSSEAFGQMCEVVMEARSAGSLSAADALLTQLRKFLPDSVLSDGERAWLLNLEGLLQSSHGQHRRATLTFRQMLVAGNRLRDTQVMAAAQQHLGIQFILRGEPLRALAPLQRAYRLTTAAHDYRRAAQNVLNITGAAYAGGKTALAKNLLDEFERVLHRIADPELSGGLHGQLGALAAARGDYAGARGHFRLALRYARAKGYACPRHQVVALQNLGTLEVESGRAARGLRWYARALAIAGAGQLPAELEQLHRYRGVALHQLSRAAEATAAFERAVHFAAQMETKHLWAIDMANLGASRISGGDLSTARADLTTALDAFVVLGDRDWQARVLGNLAAAAFEMGEDPPAVAAIERAIPLLPPGGTERRRLMRLAAQRALDRHDVATAVAWFTRVLDEARRSRKPDAVLNEAEIAGAALSAARRPEATRFFGRALRVASRRGDLARVCSILNDRGIVLVDAERYREGRRDLASCLGLARRLDDLAMQQRALTNLGILSRRCREPRTAARLLLKSVRLAYKLGTPHEEGLALDNYGAALIDGGRSSEAERVYRDALRLGRSARAHDIVAGATRGLGDVAFLRRQYDRAAGLYKRAAALRAGEKTLARVETHAAWLEALVASGRSDVDDVAQQLVDLARSLSVEGSAASAFTRVGRLFLAANQREKAAESFGVAIALVVAVHARAREWGPPQTMALLRALARPLWHVVTAEMTSPGIGELMYADLRSRVPDLGMDLERSLRPMAAQMLAIAERRARRHSKPRRRARKA